MIPRITRTGNGDMHLEATHRKPKGWRAWVGEYTILGMMAGGTLLAAANLATGGTAGLAAWLGMEGISTLGGFGLGLGAMAGGALLGSVANKAKRSYEAEHGVTIPRPGFLNQGILQQGLLKGGLSGFSLTVGAIALIGMTGLFSLASPWAVPVALAGAAIGAVRGSMERKQLMERDYEQAETAYLHQGGNFHDIGMGFGHTRAQEQTKGQSHQAAPGNSPYDFSHMGADHPAANARRSFVEAEMLRQQQPNPGIHTIH